MLKSNLAKFKLILQKAYMLNARVRHLEFKLIIQDDEHTQYLFNYLPGQFISLLFTKDSEIIRRNFSIANQPSNDNILEIAVTYVLNGLGSTKLHNMQLGESINALGPFGTFLLKPEEFINIKRYILVATGTGVTPFRAMLNMIEQLINQKNLEFILLLGVRNVEELLYAKDFIDFSNQYPNFKFYPCYSRNHNRDHSSSKEEHDVVLNVDDYVYQGYVQHQLTKFNLNPDSDLFYLCGNPNMIDEALIILKNLNVPSKHIKREKYISTK